MLKLIISHEYPPIPNRRFDYGVFIEGDEEHGFLGFGSTPTEAVQEALASQPDLFEENDWTVTIEKPDRKTGRKSRGRFEHVETPIGWAIRWKEAETQ